MTSFTSYWPFLTHNFSELVIFSPKKRIPSLCREPHDYLENFFFRKCIAKHSRKLHRSYGDICINPLGDMDDFVNIPGKIWHSLRPLYVFLGKN